MTRTGRTQTRAAALRANLQRRKVQARGRALDTTDSQSVPTPTGEDMTAAANETGPGSPVPRPD